MVAVLSSAWASLTALVSHTINSSVTPSSPLGSSLSRSSLSSASSSSNYAKHTVGFLEGSLLPLSVLKGKKLVVLGLDELLVVWNLEPQDSSMESSF